MSAKPPTKDELLDRDDFHGLPVWVCASDQHPDLVMFLPSDKDGQDVNNCPTCGEDVLESWDIYPLFLSTKDPAEESK